MDAEALEKRLRLGEDAVTEFKSLVTGSYKANKDDLAKAVCALANTKGGLLLLGIENDGTVSGIGSMENADELMMQVSKVCQDIIHPPIWCTVEKAEVKGEALLVVKVTAFSTNRPYRAGKTYYVRDANQSREAKRDELVRLLQSADYHYDEAAVEGSKWADLDPLAIRAFLETVYETPEPEVRGERLLQQLSCLAEDGTPTVSGILLFGRDPAKWLPDARISAVVIQGTEMSLDFADRKEFQGRLPDQIDAAAEFLRIRVMSPSHVEGMERVEEGIPERVLREAITNAVVHRDYRAASQIRIYVFDDRVEIVNPGDLLNKLTLEGIRVGGISQRRNPVLAGLLGRIRRRESMGIGVPAMIRMMKERKLPEPEFSISAGHFKVVLRHPAGAGRG